MVIDMVLSALWEAWCRHCIRAVLSYTQQHLEQGRCTIMPAMSTRWAGSRGWTLQAILRGLKDIV